MVPKKITYSIFYRHDNPRGEFWAKKIRAWIKKRHSEVKEDARAPKFLIVLGGDGTVLEAVRKYQKEPVIVALNLGNVGFLSSIREPKNFLRFLSKLFEGDYLIESRMMLSVDLFRGKKKIFSAEALNEVSVQNPLGLVEIEASIEGHPLQYIRGTGALVSTATGSTAFNLSAHGPVIMPEVECMIITELLDHNIPTPSLVVAKNKTVRLKIEYFRKHGLLSISETGQAIDVVLSADAANLFPLKEGDIVEIRSAKRHARLAIFEKNYFLKSIQEKFSFR